MKSSRLFLAAFSLIILFSSIAAFAADAARLSPPPGAKVAIVVFEDLQCPKCAVDSTLLHQAASTYKIPLVQHDFPLPGHDWSFQAAVNARWFDTKSKKTGDAYRSYIFERQTEITRNNLRSVSEQFAAEHKLSLPLFVDPKGELAAKIHADSNLGRRLGVSHTPTVYIVSNTAQGPVSTELTDDSQLYALIDAALKQARSTPARKATGSKATSGGPATTRAAER